MEGLIFGILRYIISFYIDELVRSSQVTPFNFAAN